MTKRERPVIEKDDIADVEWQLHWLIMLCAANDGGAGAAMHQRIGSEMNLIRARHHRLEKQLEELWQVLDEMGLRKLGESRIAGLRAGQRRWGGPRGEA